MTISRPASIVLLSAALLGGWDHSRSEAFPAAERQARLVKPAPVKPPIKARPQQPASPSPSTVGTSAPDGQPAVNAQGSATLEFAHRIEAYLKIHNEAETMVPNLKQTADPKEIYQREAALAKMIQTLRAGAQPGEIFAKEYQPYFIKIVQDDFTRRSPADRKALIWEQPKHVTIDINTVYSPDLPLATFPAALLRKLPDLPPELEYRIVGRSLILRDVKANLIVDILRDVVPTIPS